jgi:chromosome segregation ATPase
MTYPLPSKHGTSWSSYQTEITSQIGDNRRTLALVEQQLAEITEKRQSATKLLELLPDERTSKQERGRLQRFLSSTTDTPKMIGDQIEKVKARLDKWLDELEHFDTKAMDREKKLAQARASVGHLAPIAGPNEALDGGHVSRY